MVRTSCGTGKARTVDSMRMSGEEEDLVERAVGDRGIQGELYHQGCLQCPAFSRKLKSVVWRRPRVPSLSKSSNTEAHLSGLQDQAHPRPLHLAAQPGVKVSCSSAGKSTDKCERPSSPVILLAGNIICPEGRWSSQPHHHKTRHWAARRGVRGKAHRQAVKDLSKAAEKGSQWLWIKRKDSTWALR